MNPRSSQARYDFTAEGLAALALWLCPDSCTFNKGATFDLSGGRATY
jgi:hypothetical protein